MNHLFPKISVWTALALALAATSANAAPLQTKVFSTTELAYSADVSNSDLLTGLTATTTGWFLVNGATTPELNDGIHGNTFAAAGDSVEGTITTDGATAIYNLGLGANNLGYDLTSIQTIAAWVNVGFGNQAYTVDVKFKGAASYTTLATVDYQPLALDGIGATKVTLTEDTTGVLASGVEFIRFTANSVNGGQNGGYFVFRELDVFGTPTAASDIIPPTVLTRNPIDDATGVPVSSDLVLNFSEAIAKGSGNITIKNLDTSALTVIPVGDSQVSISGAVLTINPTLDLAVLTNYAIRIDSGAITDLANNPFTGITDDTAWNFTTKAPDAQEFSTTELAYSAEASNSDLLTGLTATTTGWTLLNGATTPELNDGIHGGTYDVLSTVEGAWTTVGATAEYNLGTGTGGAGYNITSIQSIASWNSAGFGNQAWTVEVKPVGGSWTTLSTVNYQPLAASAAGATKVTLTDPGGVLASGIQFIRFTANQVNGGANAGAFIWRELDVFGIPTVDVTAPTLAALSPADDATAVPAGTNLVATFNENIASGTGNITIKNLDTSALTVIPVGDSQVSISGAVLTINPSTNLAAVTNYAIQIDATAIKDLSNNPFAGIATDSIWNFTTGVPDLTAPTIVTRSPVDNATSVPVATNMVLTFNENIALGSGNITINNLSTATQTVIPVGDPQISVSGAVLTINPTGDLAVLKNYAIRIDSGAITDLSANPFAGIADDTSWNFTSASTPLRIMCLGDSITAGYTDNPSWANHPFMFGYRSGLYTRLTNAGYNFKFVGASAEPWNLAFGDPSHGGTYTPALDLRTLGQDGHRGYGGASTGAVNGNVAGYIAADTPDVILLLIGINAIGSGSPAALNTLVNTIVTAAPNARLIVAQITPLPSFNQDLYNYNIYIRDTLVPAYVAAGKKVSTVNLYSLFLTNPNDYSSAIAPNVLSNGINHPDNPHYDLMAEEWFKGIEALGLGSNAYVTWANGYLPADVSNPAADNDGDGQTNQQEFAFGLSPISGSSVNPITQQLDKTTGVFKYTRTKDSGLIYKVYYSTNLSAWTLDASANQAPAAAVAGIETVTVTLAAAAPLDGKLFVRVEASPAP